MSQQPVITWKKHHDQLYRSVPILGAFGLISGQHNSQASIREVQSDQLIERADCPNFKAARLWCEDKLKVRWASAQPLPPPAPPPPPDPLDDDWRFLESLKEKSVSPRLREIATALLTRVRSDFPGRLHYHQKAGRWVETPDNFWTLRVQSDDRTLRITLRADGQRLAVPRDIKLSADRPSYTAFKIWQMSQVSSAFILIRQAAHNRRDEYYS